MEAALGCSALRVVPAIGGLSGRTYRVSADGQTWIARFEPADGLQLRRAALAQAMARSAGVRAPIVVASNFTPTAASSYVWMVEEHLPGAHWPDRPSRDAAQALSFQLGEQLRALHAVPMEGYGLLPPSPYPMAATFSEWLDQQESGVEETLRIGGLDAGTLPTSCCAALRGAFDHLRGLPSEGPRFGRGDTVGSNLLVDGGRLVAIVDWEWAAGCDAAGNVAEWWFWHRESGDLDAFLQGYRPASPALFRRRIEAHQVLTALVLIQVYHFQRDAAGIRDTADALRKLLAAGSWG
jgi:aminoglycoside phosphotransferase (APT) family kinase protein